MKNISRWLFWLALASLAANSVCAEFFILSGPEYKRNNLFYMNHQLKDMYCITDELSSALSWNSNLDWMESDFENLNEVDKPQVLPNERYVYPASDNITCQMSLNSQCSHHWSRIGNWSYATSTIRPMAPIFDNRWEDLPEEKMTDRFRLINTIPSIGSQTVSIRGSDNAHLAICNGSQSQSFCFYIILGGWKNTLSVIRKCKDGVPEPASSVPTGECRNALVSVNTITLSTTEWKTFVIKWDFQTQLMLSIFDSNSKLMTYTEPIKANYFSSHQKLPTGGPAYYLLARSSSQILMKFHTYGYSVTTTTQSKMISPEIMTASSDRNMCIQLSISLCEKCVMTIDFIDQNGKNKAAATFQNKKSSNIYGLPAWRNVEINKTLPMEMQLPIMLSINTLLSNNSNKNNPFWAISNIRRCYNGAIKVIKMKAYQDYDLDYFWPNVTCQKFSPDGSSSIINSTDHKKTSLKTDVRPLCAEGKVGLSCSISCSRLFSDNIDCHKLLSCDTNGCSCAQGFLMPTCDNRCPISMYGFECKQKCGNCARNNCNFATGKCKFGCENNDEKLFLPPYCKIGIGSPPAPTVDLINSTCIRVFLDVEKKENNYKIIPTSISFEVWANSATAIYASEPIQVQKNTVIVETFFERLNPGTRYTILSVVHTQNKTFRGESINATTPCTESVALNFATFSNETSIIVNNWVDVSVNDTCPYTWYRVQLFSEKEKLFNDSTPFPKVFNDLEPFTQYKIIVSSEKSIILNKLISTLEGAPGLVKNLQVLFSSENKIDIMWEPPIKPKGRIVNYTAEIQPVESLGCSDFDISSYNSVMSVNELLHMQAIITNTSQSSFNHTFYGLKPYTKYLVSVYASTAKHQGEKTVLHHTTKSIETPTEVFEDLHLTNETSTTIAANLRWKPPYDCSSITGPILACKVLIRKLGENFTTIETNLYHLPLPKSTFEGAQIYEVRLYSLRYFGGPENKTAFISMNFTMPARSPPPPKNIEIVEVDSINNTTTLRWEPPTAPFHGVLDHYTIMFCSNRTNRCNENNNFIIHREEFCKLWNSTNKLCKTVSLPSINFDTVQITAHNLNVTEASESISLPVLRTEFVPSAPLELSLNIIKKEMNSINITWSHPSKSGGKLIEFIILAQLLNSSLKSEPWKIKIDGLKIDSVNYYPSYSKELVLFPSSVFNISVKSVTSTGLIGEKIESKIALPSLINFNSTDLEPKIDEELMVWIRIPKVLNDIKFSKMLIVVQGSRYCDEGPSNNEDVYSFIDTQSSLYYKVAWKAATLTEPELYANKEFQIGNSLVYGGSKNYALCSKESYVVHLVLINDSKTVINKELETSAVEILKAIKTSPIYVGEPSVNYAMWLTPLFLIFLIAMVFTLIALRRKFTDYFLKNKPSTNLPENMPLSNDFRKNKIDEVENGKIRDTKDMPFDNLFIVDKKKGYIMPVNVTDFEDYFEYAYKSGALNKEYTTIKGGPTKSCIYGAQPELKSKNRYANLFPYDETRVILEKLPDDPYSDYINANYITGYKGKEKAYIATQGPKPNTVIDFWRMIWQEKAEIICMMANLIENEKVKCEQYWPSTVGKKMLYGTISVQFSSEEIYTDYTYRTFLISSGNQKTRTVEHLHYTAWPDHGVPTNPRSIVGFLKKIQQHAPIPRKANAPQIVVHCSAGVGRTGTLIVLDIAVCRAFSERVVDIFANVLSVRTERVNMVDNVEQYLLLHLVLVEYLNSQNTCLTCDKTLPDAIAEQKKNSSYEYQRILNTSWWNEILGSSKLNENSLSSRNRAKHRFPETAGAINRLYLKRLVVTDEDSDYIAATSVKGIIKNCHYITTQLPLPTTLVDFWRMLSEQNVEYVLVLQLPNLQDPTYCELVPENQGFGNTKYLKIIRQENSTTDSQYYLKEEVLIIDSSEPTKNQVVKVISFKKWSEMSLPSPDELVNFWKTFVALPKNDQSPIVLVCRDGITASGLWLAVSYLLNRMTVDKECDIPLAVRAIRRCRKDFIKQPEHLEYLYNIALAWFDEC